MFLLIVLAIIFIVGTIISIREEEGFYMFATIAIIAVVGIVFGCLLECIGMSFENDELYDTEETPIVALADTPGSEGHIFLGAGSIESSLYYYYMVENSDGSKEISKINSRDVRLYEDEAEQPRLMTCYYRNSNPIIRFFFFTENSRIELHIPPNSVKYRFNVDLN